LTNAFGIKEGSAEDVKLEKALVKFLNDLVEAADVNNDRKVTHKEFTDAYTKFVINKVAIPAWFKEAVAVAFDLFDANNNGELTEQEIVKAVIHINPHETEENAKKGYRALKGSHAKVDKDVFSQGVWTYFSSHEPTPDLYYVFPAFRPGKH